MTDLSDEDRRIVAYLRDGVASGERYFRSRNIAEAIGLTAKQVGTRLPELADKSDAVEMEIEKWGRSRSTTWRVTRG